MIFVLMRKSDNMYVARAGGDRSYTDRLQYAKVFRTFEGASQDCCGNEVVCDVALILRPEKGGL